MTDMVRPIVSVEDAAKGGLLILKCDKPGPRSVYAQLLARQFLGGNGIRYDIRGVLLRFDDAPPQRDAWKYNDNYAFADENPLDRRMSKFVKKLRDAHRLRVRLQTYRSELVDLDFDVTGAADAIADTYRRCGDSLPQ